MTRLSSHLHSDPPADTALRDHCRAIALEEAGLREGGGSAGTDRQHKLGRLTARERIAALLDPAATEGGEAGSQFFLELGLWAAHGMYQEWGVFTAAGVVTGIGRIAGRDVMIIANDATVKAGAFVPMTCKKIIRAQRIAFESALPIVYLVDSSGVFLPLQDEVFPDEDDFGRIFRNNAVLSAGGVPQFAAIMGNCVAGGAYLPVLCDKVLMTEGSGLYLAGPSLVKAAIGQNVDSETLGGATMHATISGSVDFQEKDDAACLDRLKSLVALLPAHEVSTANASSSAPPAHTADALYSLVSLDGRKEYDARDLLACIVDSDTIDEYKAGYGTSLVCAYARMAGRPVGVVANQRIRTQSPKSGLQMPGVIYADSAEKAARFILDCNQTRLPILFFQDVSGFMVGKDAEESGIIRAGAKLVNAVSNSTVPKITVIVGGSYGAGNYALCGKAFDPRFIFAWPNAHYAVMGAAQASTVVYDILARGATDRSPAQLDALREKVKRDYTEQTDMRYGAARGWVDAIIQPHETRAVLIAALGYASRPMPKAQFHTGVLQV